MLVNASDGLKKDDVVLFVEGRDERPIAYTTDGKIILCKNNITTGYAKIKSIEERRKVIIVEAENIFYDYYHGMDYEDFLKLLPTLNFKVGYDLPFDYEGKVEHQIFAYNLNNHMVIVAETWDGGNEFNSIYVYCPNINGLRYRSRMLLTGSVNMAVLDIVNPPHNCNPIRELMIRMKDRPKEWPTNESIHLEHYMDRRYDIDGFELWDRTITRILLAPAEVDEIFKNCTRMQPILAKRNHKTPIISNPDDMNF